MPFVQSPVTLIRGITAGRAWWHFYWTETGVGVGDESAISAAASKNPDGSPSISPPIPHEGTITLIRSTLTSFGIGTAVTVAPRMGRIPNPTPNTNDYITGLTPAAVSFNEALNVRYVFQGSGPPTIRWRSKPDAGVNGSVANEIVIYEGHI